MTNTRTEELAVLYAAAIANTLLCIDNNRDELEATIEAQIDRKVSEPLVWNKEPQMSWWFSTNGEWMIVRDGHLAHFEGAGFDLCRKNDTYAGDIIALKFTSVGVFRTLAEAKNLAEVWIEDAR